MTVVDLTWLQQKLIQYSDTDQQRLICYTQKIDVLKFDQILSIKISPKEFNKSQNQQNLSVKSLTEFINNPETNFYFYPIHYENKKDS